MAEQRITDEQLPHLFDDALETAQVQALRALGPVVLRTLAGMGLVITPVWIPDMLRRVLAGPKDSVTNTTKPEAPDGTEH